MSPRTPAAYREMREARREAILSAARLVFARNGLAATRIGDIAAEAGISQGLLYHYFPNKEALFTAIVEEALRETAELTGSALQLPVPAWERLHRLCEQMLTGVLEHPEYPLVIVQVFTSAAVPEAARAAVEMYGQQTLRDIVALIRAGQEEGTVVAGHALELAVALSACIQGVALSRLQARRPDAPLPSVETVLRLLRA